MVSEMFSLQICQRNLGKKPVGRAICGVKGVHHEDL